jgi:hypothetical protein
MTAAGDLRVDIEHDDLDPAEPEAPTTGVYVSVIPADGMRYSASVYVEGAPDADQLAEMIQRASVAAAAAHSPELLNAVRGPGY